MRLGVIDIGYNAIRAVVYENNTLGSPEIFNNKFKNDTLSLLSNENLDIKHQTYLSLNYIKHIFTKLNVLHVKCVATAVLREHNRAADFVQHIKKLFDFDIEIISGDKEAYLTATGLISGMREVNGIAADLGGGSLELIEIQNNNIGKLKSLELGTKVINTRNIRSFETIVDILREDYGTHHYQNLYLIGGALRFICRYFIDFAQYPIKNLHNLEITCLEFENYLDKIQLPHILKSKLGKKRINLNAILIAKAMIKIFSPEKIIVSTFGLKEGVRYEMIDKQEQKKDIIIEKAKYYSHYTENTDFDSYFNILKPLIFNNQDAKRIMQLSIIFSFINKYFDQTLSPKVIAENILSSEIPFTHRMRIIIALALSYATNFKPEINLLKISKKLVTKEEHDFSQILGNFIRIAKDIDGPIFTKPSFNIRMQNHYLEIESQEILPRPIFEKICERLKSIAFARKNSFHQSVG